MTKPRGISVRRPCGEPFRPDEIISYDSSEQRYGLSTRRGRPVTFFPDERAAELRDLFFESATEILQAMNEAGLALEDHPGDKESLRSVRRAVHTLKGDSAAFWFCGISGNSPSLS